MFSSIISHLAMVTHNEVDILHIYSLSSVLKSLSRYLWYIHSGMKKQSVLVSKNLTLMCTACCAHFRCMVIQEPKTELTSKTALTQEGHGKEWKALTPVWEARPEDRFELFYLMTKPELNKTKTETTLWELIFYKLKFNILILVVCSAQQKI